MDRRDIGSWLSGPKAALEEQGLDFGYPGQRFGLPKQGIGSVARMGRRIIALMIDWIAAILVTHLVFPDLVYGSEVFAAATLGIFAAQVFLLTATTGASFGYKLSGIRLISISPAPITFLKVLARTALLCLVVPALIWDRDGRGLHDKAVGTITMRAR
ncbi:MAG: hypothetical protein RJB51_480 [Actinomycetota bacterium]